MGSPEATKRSSCVLRCLSGGSSRIQPSEKSVSPAPVSVVSLEGVSTTSGYEPPCNDRQERTVGGGGGGGGGGRNAFAHIAFGSGLFLALALPSVWWVACNYWVMRGLSGGDGHGVAAIDRLEEAGGHIGHTTRVICRELADSHNIADMHVICETGAFEYLRCDDRRRCLGQTIRNISLAVYLADNIHVLSNSNTNLTATPTCNYLIASYIELRANLTLGMAQIVNSRHLAPAVSRAVFLVTGENLPCRGFCNISLIPCSNLIQSLSVLIEALETELFRFHNLNGEKTFTLLLVVPLNVIALFGISIIIYCSSNKRKLDDVRKHTLAYTNQAIEQSIHINQEKYKSDTLIYQMLPRTIADNLKFGRTVEAEHFENASILFSDIVGFSDVAMVVEPIQIVDFLNTVYRTLDRCVDQFAVYKVETVSDSYLLAGGLPERQVTPHVSEMASLALSMISMSDFFSLPNSSEPLPLRIGINSDSQHTLAGPVVAGVIGLKNPRYCLFGDSVNTASRMLSTGEAHRIQTTGHFKSAVECEGGFEFVERGTISVKGKGNMKTFWLSREVDTDNGVRF